VFPYQMAAVEQRVAHEKLDRMINAGDPNRVISYFRKFIEKHYDVLRRRMRQVKYLARRAKEDTKYYRVWDIPCLTSEECSTEVDP